MVGGFISQQFTAMVAFANRGPQEIEASLIKITDGNGKVHGLIGLIENKVQIKLMDGSGRDRLTTFVDSNSAGITLKSATGSPAISLTNDKDNNSFIVLHNRGGAPNLVTCVQDNIPMTAYMHPNAKPKLTIGVGGAKNSNITVLDESGHIRSQFGLVKGTPHISLVGADNVSKVAIEMHNDNDPMIGLIDNKGVMRGALALTENLGSYLSLCKENGKIAATLAVGPQTGSTLSLALPSDRLGFLAYARGANAGVRLFNDGGKDGFVVQTDAAGSSLGFLDSQKKMRAVAGVRGDKPWIGVLDPTGAPVWGSPGPAPNLPPMGDLDAAATRDLLR
jgi:hypothetical protein